MNKRRDKIQVERDTYRTRQRKQICKDRQQETFAHREIEMWTQRHVDMLKEGEKC